MRDPGRQDQSVSAQKELAHLRPGPVAGDRDRGRTRKLPGVPGYPGIDRNEARVLFKTSAGGLIRAY